MSFCTFLQSLKVKLVTHTYAIFSIYTFSPPKVCFLESQKNVMSNNKVRLASVGTFQLTSPNGVQANTQINQKFCKKGNKAIQQILLHVRDNYV